MALESTLYDAHEGQSILAVVPQPQSCEGKLRAYLFELFPDPLVFRHRVTKQSRGLISSRTLANYDCAARPTYPLSKLIYNGRVCYERDQFVEFLLSKLKFRVGECKKARIDQLLEDFELDGGNNNGR